MKTWRRWLAVLALCVVSSSAPKPSSAQASAGRRARDLIVGLDLDAAGRLLGGADPDAAAVALERARLALYEMDCDAASVILARPDVQAVDDGALVAEIARGCSRVTAATTADRDDALGVDVQWQDERDAPLAPLLVDTVVRAREMLSRDLGVDWPKPTRVVVVRDSRR